MVMFFVFHLLILIILQISNTKSFAIKRETQSDGRRVIGNERYSNFEDAAKTNGSAFSTHKPLQIVQNSAVTKSLNLKSNVFDKMLSDEMFSIKQHLFEKDLQILSTVKKTTKNNVPTPTLEVKQKWPVIELMSKLNSVIDGKEYIEEAEDGSLKELETEIINLNKAQLSIDKREQDNNTDNTKFAIYEESSRYEQSNARKRSNQSRDKVIGLRSLYEGTSHHKQFGTKLCTCMKTNPSTTCTHLCTGSSTVHAKNCKTNNYESTRKVITCTRSSTQNYPAYYTYSPNQYITTATQYPVILDSPFYVPYQTYFITVPTKSPYRNIMYYHPNAFNYLKVPTTRKHRKTTKRHKDDDLYYDNYSTESDEDDDDYIENKRDIYDNKQKPEKVTDLLVTYVDAGENQDRKPNNSTEVNQIALVDAVIHDLKTLNSDTVIKDCYCSSAPHTIIVRSFTFWCILRASLSDLILTISIDFRNSF